MNKLTHEDIARIAHGVVSAYERSKGNMSFPPIEHESNSMLVSSVASYEKDPSLMDAALDGVSDVEQQRRGHLFNTVVKDLLEVKRRLDSYNQSLAPAPKRREYPGVQGSESQPLNVADDYMAQGPDPGSEETADA